MRTPTIRDVAKRAGVGVGTVSRVLNGSHQVREETRQKVLDAIRELNFQPNTAARQLSGGKTYTIGVVTAFFTFPSFVERLIGVQDILNDSSYDMVLYSIRSLNQLERSLRNLVSQNRVDGLLILSLPFSEELLQKNNPALPVVAVDNDTVTHYPSIMIDNRKGGYMATQYLIERGHRHIGFIGDLITNPFGFTSTAKRYEGYQQALAEAGLPLREEWVRFGKYDQETACENALEILSQPERPTAIFAAIDRLAFGALAATQELGMVVPGDVAIMGFDNIQAAGYMQLTTIHQHLTTSGRIGARQLLTWLQEGSLPQNQWRTELELHIIERATT